MQGKGPTVLIWTALFVGVLVPIGVLLGYGLNLGPISHTPSDWGNFGAVLGGAFTILGPLVTAATLYFLHTQQQRTEQRQERLDEENQVRQKAHDELLKKQIKSLTFEHYLQHRKLFIERLSDLSRSLNNEIKFNTPDTLYRQIFHKNNPLQCDLDSYILPLETTQAGDISDCLNWVRSTESRLENHHTQNTEPPKTIIIIMKTNKTLGITHTRPLLNGDIFFDNQITGINIYDLADCIYKIELTLNSFLFYSGNQEIEPIHHKAHQLNLRDKLFKSIDSNKNSIFEIHYNNQAIPILHKLLLVSDKRNHDGSRLLEKTFDELHPIFCSTKKLSTLNEREVMVRISGQILAEITFQQASFSDSESQSILTEAHQLIIAFIAETGGLG